MSDWKYVIEPNEWDYDGYRDVIANYVDGDSRFKIVMIAELDRRRDISAIKIAGESTGVLDRGNAFFYDLSHGEFTSRAWLDKYMTADDCLDDSGNVRVNIEIPKWFLSHMNMLSKCESVCDKIFDVTMQDKRGEYMSLVDVIDVIREYIEHNVSADFIEEYQSNVSDPLYYDVFYVAKEKGKVSSSADGMFVID